MLPTMMLMDQTSCNCQQIPVKCFALQEFLWSYCFFKAIEYSLKQKWVSGVWYWCDRPDHAACLSIIYTHIPVICFCMCVYIYLCFSVYCLSLVLCVCVHVCIIQGYPYNIQACPQILRSNNVFVLTSQDLSQWPHACAHLKLNF